jgi:hypothetical protein
MPNSRDVGLDATRLQSPARQMGWMPRTVACSMLAATRTPATASAVAIHHRRALPGAAGPSRRLAALRIDDRLP